VRWVDRLGRDYADVCKTIRVFMRKEVLIRTMINNMTFDSAAIDPISQAIRDALLGLMAAMHQAQVEASKEAQKAGIAHARESGAYGGRRPSFDASIVQQVVRLKNQGTAISCIARDAGLTRQTVYRILADPTASIAKARVWGTIY